MKVNAYCKEDETVHDEKDCADLGFTWTEVAAGKTKYVDNQIGGGVGYGYATKGCPDCVGVEGDTTECENRCNHQELFDCSGYMSENTCQVPGTNCRWSSRRNVCFDPSYKIDHPDAWFGLVCAEKCGTDVNYGHHPPKFCEGVNMKKKSTIHTKAECRAEGGSWESSLDQEV